MTLSETSEQVASELNGFLPGGVIPTASGKFNSNVRIDDAVEPSDPDLENCRDPLAAVDQQYADGFEKGYSEGFEAGRATVLEIENQSDALAIAIDSLKPVDIEKLTALLYLVVLDLFKEAIGTACPEQELLLDRCHLAVSKISKEYGDASIYVAPNDVAILGIFSDAITIRADEALLPGSVRLVHEHGEIVAGSVAIIDQIEDELSNLRNVS